MKHAAATIILAAAMAGCPATDPGKTAGSATAAALSAASSSRRALDAPDPSLPVPADFEKAADDEIDARNYGAELEAIAAELGGKPGSDAGADAATDGG